MARPFRARPPSSLGLDAASRTSFRKPSSCASCSARASIEAVPSVSRTRKHRFSKASRQAGRIQMPRVQALIEFPVAKPFFGGASSSPRFSKKDLPERYLPATATTPKVYSSSRRSKNCRPSGLVA